MNTTGYALREALRRVSNQISTARTQFDANQYYFGEIAPDLTKLGERLCALESKLATLQAAQCPYNAIVRVNFNGKERSLAEAIKMSGVASRLEAMWRKLVQSEPAGNSRFGLSLGGSPTRRDKEAEYAKPAMSQDDIVAQAEKFGKMAAEVRAAVATGNMIEVCIDGLEEL